MGYMSQEGSKHPKLIMEGPKNKTLRFSAFRYSMLRGTRFHPSRYPVARTLEELGLILLTPTSSY